MMEKLSKKFLSLSFTCVFWAVELYKLHEMSYTPQLAGCGDLEITPLLGQHFSLHHSQLSSYELLTISLPSKCHPFLSAKLNGYPHISVLGVEEGYVLHAEMSYEKAYMDRSYFFYVIARRELSCSGRVYLLQFIAAIVADYSMWEGCITRAVAEVIMKWNHEALEHLNCLICPPWMSSNSLKWSGQEGKAADSQESYCNTKGLNLAPGNCFCLCKQLRLYFLRKKTFFFRERSVIKALCFICCLLSHHDLPRDWPIRFFAPICSCRLEESYH